jgi:hypothetical protein
MKQPKYRKTRSESILQSYRAVGRKLSRPMRQDAASTFKRHPAAWPGALNRKIAN